MSPISLYFYLKIVKIQIQYNNNRHLHCPHWFFFQSNREETFLISIKSFQIPNTFKYIFNLFCSYSIQFNSIQFHSFSLFDWKFYLLFGDFSCCNNNKKKIRVIQSHQSTHLTNNLSFISLQER